MSKSKLRSKILNLRKKNSNKKLSLNPERIYQFLKKNKINLKNVGGYYPCNHEIDDLDMLYFLRNKKVKISLLELENQTNGINVSIHENENNIIANN